MKEYYYFFVPQRIVFNDWEQFLNSKPKIPMWKKLLIKLALGVVLDMLLAYALNRFNEVVDLENKRKWKAVIDFLQEAKAIGLPL